MTITLSAANRMITTGRQLARQRGLLPLTFCVLDRSGHIVSAQSEDGAALLHFDLAFAKAWGCVGLGHSTRYFKDVLVKQRPQAASGLEVLSRGRFIAEYGGVLVRDGTGDIIGAVGVAGDVDSNDESVAVAIIEAAGLKADLA